MDPVRLLVFNAGLQILVSSLVGLLMLVPLQPWGRRLMPRIRSWRDVSHGHVDWFMLAFMQLAAAFGMQLFETPSLVVPAWLLVFGGWANALPYLVRGLTGVDGFVLGGPPRQVLMALFGLASTLALIVAWGWLLTAWWIA